MRDELGRFIEGHISWNKDLHICCNSGRTHFKKGNQGYWLGKKRDEKTKEKIKLKQKGRHNSFETEFKSNDKRLIGENNPSKRLEVRKILSEQKKGEKNPMFGKCKELHPNWRGGEYYVNNKWWRKLSKEILKRDNNKCIICGSSYLLTVHHILPFKFSKDHSINNLITLCRHCHPKVEFGKIKLGDNNPIN